MSLFTVFKSVWTTAKSFPLIKFLARLCCSKQVDEMLQCTLCTHFYLDTLNHITSDCSYYKIHACKTDYYAQLQTLFDSICELLLCSTSATWGVYFWAMLTLP